jgi:hypothetical protein
MALEFTDTQMEIYIKVSGKMINSKETDYLDLQMALSMKGSFLKVNLMDRVSINISQSNTMTSNNTVDLGMPLSLMGLEKPFTTMVMCIRDNLSKDKGVGLEPIGLTRFINILVTGNIIAFGEKVNSIKMMMSFFKDSLRKG